MHDSVLNKIKQVLEALSLENDSDMDGVFYGLRPEEKFNKWNFFVYRRNSTKISGTSNATRQFQTYYEINIIHEDYIPEGYVERVIEALEKEADGPKLKLKSESIDYAYSTFSGTNLVVEIAHFILTVPEKRH